MSNSIKKSVDALLKKHKITTIPVDVEKICEEEGITVSYADLRAVEKKYEKEISGVLLTRLGENDIIVNEKDNEKRQRFTIAHELGHYFLHHDHDTKKKSMMVSFRGARTEREYEADRFAAELLMPENAVEEEYSKLSASNAPYISVLAKIFDVSKAAMAYRLDNLRKIYINL